MALKSVIIYASTQQHGAGVGTGQSPMYICMSLGLQGKSKVRASGPFKLHMVYTS